MLACEASVKISESRLKEDILAGEPAIAEAPVNLGSARNHTKVWMLLPLAQMVAMAQTKIHAQCALMGVSRWSARSALSALSGRAECLKDLDTGGILLQYLVLVQY